MPTKETQNEKMDFRSGFNKLEELTEWFERGDLDVEQGLKKFEEGLRIVSTLKKQLKEVEAKVLILKKKAVELED